MSQTINSFGWAPVGQRLLREYSNEIPQYETPPTSRFVKTWKEIKSMQSMGKLLELAVAQMQLLHAIDTFPRGGLCQGSNLKEALRRYERLWLPLVAAHATAPGSSGAEGYSHLVPPLDIAFLWHLHRLQPALYEKDCREYRSKDGRPLTGALHVTPQQAFAFTDGSDRAGAGTAAVWRKAFPNEPFYPPAAPGSQTAGFRSQLAADLAAVAVRVPVYTHQLLRACYNQLPFLSRAVDRERQQQTLVCLCSQLGPKIHEVSRQLTTQEQYSVKLSELLQLHNTASQWWLGLHHGGVQPPWHCPTTKSKASDIIKDIRVVKRIKFLRERGLRRGANPANIEKLVPLVRKLGL